MQDLTITIVAHNAAETIERALRSIRVAGEYAILLVADGCTDETVEIAQANGGDSLTVEELPVNRGVGTARAHAVSKMKTPYGMWLDADDEIEPNRPAIMLEALKAGADLVFDAGVLIDASTGETLKDLPMPDFMMGPGTAVRCFERNWFPFLACGFATSFVRAIQFDTQFDCAEDYDFLLRAVAGGANIKVLNQKGYRYYHQSDSISRNLEKTRAYVKKAMEKHSFSTVAALLDKSRLEIDEQWCVLAGHALYRGNYDIALEYAVKVKAENMSVAYGMPLCQLAVFLQATAYAKLEQWQKAYDVLAVYSDLLPSADALNNMGVILFNLGQIKESQAAFGRALALMPGYHDAQQNLAAVSPTAITTHPLRRTASRDGYVNKP